jgi:DNA-binding NarL/FixJ family response regulator
MAGLVSRRSNFLMTLAYANGELCPQTVEAVLTSAAQASRRTATERVAGLRPREIEVLRLIAGGQTAKDAARALEISPKTADNISKACIPKSASTHGRRRPFMLLSAV